MGPKLTFDGQDHEIEIVARRPNLVLRIDGRRHEVASLGHGGTGHQTLTIDDAPFSFVQAHAGERSFVRHAGRTFELRYLDPREAAEEAGSGDDDIKAPMPGSVVSVHKQPGDAVSRGETIVTIESMKLQTALVAPRDGTLAEIARKEGDVFNKDEIIARLEAVAGEE